MMKSGPLIILSGPSGCGKSTIIRRILEEPPYPLRLAISATTREPRPKEQNGVHYHFWSREQFEEAIASNGFLEYAEVHGRYYGTLRNEVFPHLEQGTGVILDIDVQGRAQVKSQSLEVSEIFIRTSTLDELRRRLLARKTETEEAIQRRLNRAEQELKHAHTYQYQVINDQLDSAVQEVKQILRDIIA